MLHDAAVHSCLQAYLSKGCACAEFSNVRFKGDDAKADAVYDGIIPLNAHDVADSVLYAATR